MRVALGITGCIAAYKAVEVMRGLQKAGASVHVVMTASARRFVGPLTFESLSGNPVITGMFTRGQNREIQHISLAQSVQLLAVVPATANVLGKFAAGIADDFLTTLYLSCPAPVLLAPAMNVEMWNHPAVRHNVRILQERGHRFVAPEPGMLACGMEGEGRLAEVETIVRSILGLLSSGASMAGTKVLVTAGPTIEDLDPVRFISNRSSGKMGYAFAEAARRRGAEVVLVSGPTALAPPAGVKLIPVRSAAEMKAAVMRHYPETDIVVKAAAVSDYRPREYAAEKIKKSGTASTIQLVPTEDILEALGGAKQNQVLVGFAAETRALEQSALDKLRRKNLDLVVGNNVSEGVFGSDSANVWIFDAAGNKTEVSGKTKLSIADRVLDMALAVREARRKTPVSS